MKWPSVNVILSLYSLITLAVVVAPCLPWLFLTTSDSSLSFMKWFSLNMEQVENSPDSDKATKLEFDYDLWHVERTEFYSFSGEWLRSNNVFDQDDFKLDLYRIQAVFSIPVDVTRQFIIPYILQLRIIAFLLIFMCLVQWTLVTLSDWRDAALQESNEAERRRLAQRKDSIVTPAIGFERPTHSKRTLLSMTASIMCFLLSLILVVRVVTIGTMRVDTLSASDYSFTLKIVPYSFGLLVLGLLSLFVSCIVQAVILYRRHHRVSYLTFAPHGAA